MPDNQPRRVLIVGAGGVGNNLARGLGMMFNTNKPNSAIILVDGDNFENKTVDRQMFSGLGNKAEVLAKDLQPMFSNTFIIPDRRWVISDDSNIKDEESSVKAGDLLLEDDIVYVTVDNHAARKAIFDSARNFDNIDVFTGGNDDRLYGSVYHYRRREGQDVTDHPSFWHEELVNPPDKNPAELSCQERAQLEGGTQTVAANMGVATFLLGMTQTSIFEDGELHASEQLFDLEQGLALASDRRVEEEQEINVVSSK